MPEYKGVVEDINFNQLGYITSVFQNHGFDDAEVTVLPVGAVGDNYMADVRRFVAEKNGVTFKMIVKLAPTNEHMRQMANTNIIFKNEFTMYAEVLPKFTQLEIEAGIPENDRLRYAKFYGGCMDAPHELIIRRWALLPDCTLLEDLQEPGFVIMDRFKFLNNETVKLILKSFAKLHGLSFVVKYNEPKLFDEFKGKLINIWDRVPESDLEIQYFRNMEEDACSLLSNDKYKKALKGKLVRMGELSKNLYKYDHNSRFSVIQQGDSWTNNIMFRMDKDGEIPLQCCMVDYQLSKVNNPVADLHYMIFNCTDYKTRSKHFVEWLDYYHANLGKVLFEFGMKVDYCYPRDQLDADMKRHARVSLGLTTMLASILTRKSDDAAKLKKSMQAEDPIKAMTDDRVVDFDVETTELFKARIEGTIDTMLELGYL